MTRDDPAIAAIHETRRQISADFSHDPRLLVEYYRELECTYQSRVLAYHDAAVLTATTYEPVETPNLVLAETRSPDYGDESNAD